MLQLQILHLFYHGDYSQQFSPFTQFFHLRDYLFFREQPAARNEKLLRLLVSIPNKPMPNRTMTNCNSGLRKLAAELERDVLRKDSR